MMKGRENTMLNQKQIDFVKHAKKLYPNKAELTLAELVRANKEFGHKYEPQWLTKDKNLKIDRGLFKLPNIDDDVSEDTKETKVEFAPAGNNNSLVTPADCGCAFTI